MSSASLVLAGALVSASRLPGLWSVHLASEQREAGGAMHYRKHKGPVELELNFLPAYHVEEGEGTREAEVGDGAEGCVCFCGQCGLVGLPAAGRRSRAGHAIAVQAAGHRYNGWAHCSSTRLSNTDTICCSLLPPHSNKEACPSSCVPVHGHGTAQHDHRSGGSRLCALLISLQRSQQRHQNAAKQGLGSK